MDKQNNENFEQQKLKKPFPTKIVAIVASIIAVAAIGTTALVISLNNKGDNDDLPKHVCSFGEWSETKAPTCTAEGKKTSRCSCGKEKVEAIAKVDHTFSEWEMTKEATCAQNGENTRECECGTKEINPIEKLPHTFGSWVTTKEPTCKESGVASRVCSVCESEDFDTIAKTNDHTEVIDAAIPSSCNKTGLTEGKHCSVCNVVIVKQNVVPKENHTYDNKYDEFCNVCNFKRPTECDHSEVNIIPDRETSCLVDGLTEGKRCKICEETVIAQTRIPATGHKEESVAGIAPTCSATGLSDGVRCSFCNKMLVEQNVIPKADHTYDLSTVAPTCEEQGYTLHSCSTCGAEYKDNYVSKIAHTWGEWQADGSITLRRCINECNCGKSQRIISLSASYSGIRLLTGESVYKDDVTLNATLSDESTVRINGEFILENAVMTVGGDNYVTVKFMTASTTVAVPAIYNNVTGTTATSEFTYTTHDDAVTITGFIGSSTDVVIPAHINRVPVRFIGNSAFNGKEGIKSIVIPDSVTTIEDDAFNNCKRLQTVSFGKGLTRIGARAFINCISL